MSTTKQFRLHRTPVYRAKGDPEWTTITRMPEPEIREKRIEATNLDDLLKQAQGFGDEFGRACDVSIKCLTGRSFNQTPYRLRCNYDNMPEPPTVW